MKHKFIFLASSIALLIIFLSFTQIETKLKTNDLHYRISSKKLDVSHGKYSLLNNENKRKENVVNNHTTTCTDQVNIPDINFKNELLTLDIDTNKDGVICRDEAEAYTGALFLTGLNIYNLTGIEAFTNITELHCAHNKLTSLDVSNNLLLQKLSCNNNQIENLDISKNTALNRLACEKNKLTNLNVANGNNVNMTAMRAHKNPTLSCIQHDENFSPNTSSSWLKDTTAQWSTNCVSIGPPAGSKVITVTTKPNATINIDLLAEAMNSSIWIETSPGEFTPVEVGTSWTGYVSYTVTGTILKIYGNIKMFDCSFNYANITGLDISGNTSLSSLLCYSNEINELDLSKNTTLNSVYCQNNKLKKLNVANGNNINFVEFSVSTNKAFDATGNPDLNCIQIDAGFTPPTTGDNKWLKDTTAQWSTTPCDPSGPPAGSKVITVTTKPNATIKIDLEAIEENTPIWIETAEGDYTNITVGTSWTDFVEYTVVGNTLKIYGNITSFDCSENEDNIINLDVTKNNILTGIWCYYNQISNLDLTQNPELKYLDCEDNIITELNVTNNKKLVYIDCGNNQLRTLDVSQNKSLTRLKCYNNNISELDISKATKITFLECNNNELINLNVANGNNINFVEFSVSTNKAFDATGNPDLNCIQIDAGFTPPTTGDNKWLKDATAQWSTTPCSSLPPAGSKVITVTTKPNANIKLNMFADSANTPAWVETSDGNYTKINIGTSWASVFGSYTVSGTTLKIHGNITGFDCNSNMSNLLGIDTSKNSALKELYCVTNSLNTLDISQNKNLTKLYCDGNQLSQLKTDENTELTTLGCKNNQITDLDISKNVNLLALFASNNNLSTLNVANGNNTNIIAMEVNGNSLLKCIQIDEGFTPGSGWKKDATAQWSTTPCSVSTSEIENKENPLKAFPNPVRNYVTLSGLKKGKRNNIKVFNSLGKEIMNLYSKESEIKINLNSIPTGLYILSVQSKGLNSSLKILKK